MSKLTGLRKPITQLRAKAVQAIKTLVRVNFQTTFPNEASLGPFRTSSSCQSSSSLIIESKLITKKKLL